MFWGCIAYGEIGQLIELQWLYFQYFRGVSPILEEIHGETQNIYARQCSLPQSEKHNKLDWQEKDSSVNLAALIPRNKSPQECLGIIDDERPKEATTWRIEHSSHISLGSDMKKGLKIHHWNIQSLYPKWKKWTYLWPHLVKKFIYTPNRFILTPGYSKLLVFSN